MDEIVIARNPRSNASSRRGFRQLIDKAGEGIDSKGDYFDRYGSSDISAATAETPSAEFSILTESFRREVCKGFDPRFVLRVLHRRGHLVAGEGGRLDRKEQLPGIGPARCYRARPSVFEDELL